MAFREITLRMRRMSFMVRCEYGRCRCVRMREVRGSDCAFGKDRLRSGEKLSSSVGEGKRLRRMRLSLGLAGGLSESYSSSDPGGGDARAIGGDLDRRLPVTEEDRRIFEDVPVVRMKLAESFLVGVAGWGLSTGEILELADKSSNMCAAVFGRESEISSRPDPVLIPRRISSALGLLKP